MKILIFVLLVTILIVGLSSLPLEDLDANFRMNTIGMRNTFNGSMINVRMEIPISGLGDSDWGNLCRWPHYELIKFRFSLNLLFLCWFEMSNFEECLGFIFEIKWIKSFWTRNLLIPTIFQRILRWKTKKRGDRSCRRGKLRYFWSSYLSPIWNDYGFWH